MQCLGAPGVAIRRRPAGAGLILPRRLTISTGMKRIRDMARNGRFTVMALAGASGLLASALAAPATGSGAQDVTGVWMTQKRTAAVELSSCEGTLCGRIVWLADPTRPDGDVKRDRENPDPALRERPWCGTEVITGLEPTGPGRWDGGRFYYFKHGRDYDLAMEREGETLRLRAYLGLKALGRTEIWERADPGIEFCPQAADAS